jgi:hypothetical protein
MKKILLAMAPFVLCGCVSNYTVPAEATERITKQGYATIQATRNVDSKYSPKGVDWTSFAITKVSSFSGDSNTGSTLTDFLFQISPGACTVGVNVLDFNSLWGGNVSRSAIGEITFLALPGRSYVLSGFAELDFAVVWIAERDTVAKVTEEIRLPFSQPVETKYDIPAYTPIIIPVK